MISSNGFNTNNTNGCHLNFCFIWDLLLSVLITNVNLEAAQKVFNGLSFDLWFSLSFIYTDVSSPFLFLMQAAHEMCFMVLLVGLSSWWTHLPSMVAANVNSSFFNNRTHVSNLPKSFLDSNLLRKMTKILGDGTRIRNCSKRFISEKLRIDGEGELNHQINLIDCRNRRL